MESTQLTLFESCDHHEADLSLVVSDIKEELGNVRRGLFRRYGELRDEMRALRADLDALLQGLNEGPVEEIQEQPSKIYYF